MADMDDVMQKFCDAGARALRRYVEVSGDELRGTPEYFMPAFILNEIGDEITVTLETGFSKLFAWNEEARQRRDLRPRGPDEEMQLLKLAEELGRPRVDLVRYQGQEQGIPKDKQDFLALVEFKRGWLSPNDRTKLLRILPHIDTCPYGVTCGSVRGQNLGDQKRRTREAGDQWFQSCGVTFPGEGEYFFCAGLFRSPIQAP